MKDKKWPTWSVVYNIDGSQWVMHIVAKDADDAMRRLKQAAAWGKVDGELIASVPVWCGGFFVPLVVWFHNTFKAR